MKFNFFLKSQLVAVLILLSFVASSQLKVAKIFSDHTVLQRDQPVKVWGWATQNSEVSVQFASQNVNATADNSGKWLATLNAMSANKNPQVLTIKSGTGTETAKLETLLIGDGS
jgi:sialate O-acetylesterase